jgi:hypothetical protein
LGSGIAFRETEEKNFAVGFVKQSMDKSISSIDDVDHEEGVPSLVEGW